MNGRMAKSSFGQMAILWVSFFSSLSLLVVAVLLYTACRYIKAENAAVKNVEDRTRVEGRAKQIRITEGGYSCILSDYRQTSVGGSHPMNGVGIRVRVDEVHQSMHDVEWVMDLMRVGDVMTRMSQFLVQG